MHSSLIRVGTCSRFQLVLVHAEDDTTMPWQETEALFQSTIRAATDACQPNSALSKEIQVVDLGEAGRQEVFQRGTCSISKTIAKHGGTYPTPAIWHRGARVSRLSPQDLRICLILLPPLPPLAGCLQCILHTTAPRLCREPSQLLHALVSG